MEETLQIDSFFLVPSAYKSPKCELKFTNYFFHLSEFRLCMIFPRSVNIYAKYVYVVNFNERSR